MKEPQELHFCFVSADDLFIEHLQAVSFLTVAESVDEALARLERALNTWMQESEEGADAWSRCGGEFNISELLSYFDKAGNPPATFRPYLEAEGIFKIKDLFRIAQAEQVSSDRILVHPNPFI